MALLTHTETEATAKQDYGEVSNLSNTRVPLANGGRKEGGRKEDEGNCAVARQAGELRGGGLPFFFRYKQKNASRTNTNAKPRGFLEEDRRRRGAKRTKTNKKRDARSVTSKST